MATSALSRLLKFSNSAINRRQTLSFTATTSTELLIQKILGPQLSRSISGISNNLLVDQNSVSYGTGNMERNNGGRLSMLPSSGIGQSGISMFHKNTVNKEEEENEIDEDDFDIYEDDEIFQNLGIDDDEDDSDVESDFDEYEK